MKLFDILRSIGWTDDGAQFLIDHKDDPRLARFFRRLAKHPPEPLEDFRPPAKQRRGQPAQPGYIYLLEGKDSYKIGRTKDIQTRMKSFGLLLPFSTRLVHIIQTGDMTWAEGYLHQAFRRYRVNGEWFDLSPDDVAWICSLTSLDPGEYQ